MFILFYLKGIFYEESKEQQTEERFNQRPMKSKQKVSLDRYLRSLGSISSTSLSRFGLGVLDLDSLRMGWCGYNIEKHLYFWSLDGLCLHPSQMRMIQPN